MSFEGVPYLYQNKNGSFRVLAKGVDKYFKATEKDKAIKFAKGVQKNLDKELKGFITRQELGKKLGIKDVAIESAKMGNTRLWNEISNQMEIKKVGRREYYKFKGKEKDAIDSIKKFSGAEAQKGARDFYAGKETVAGKIRKILNETEVPLNVKEIQAKLPKGTKIATIKTFLADVKTMPEYAELKKKIKNIDKYESAGAAAVTKRKASAPYIIAVRNTFVNDPDADTQDVAEGMFGTKKYRSASKLDKFDMDQMARLNIIRFLQEVGGKGSKVPVPGFKDIAPNKLGDIIESIESRTDKFGFEPGERKRFQQAIADSLRNLPVNYTEKLKAKLKMKGMAVDEVNPTASVFRQAPGYIEATQVIPFETNKIKGTTLDALFGKTLPKVMAGDFSGVDNFNQKSVEFAKKYNIDTPIIRIGTGLNPEDYVTNFSDYTKGGQKNIKQLAKEKNFVIETKSKPLQLLVNEISKMFSERVKEDPSIVQKMANTFKIKPSAFVKGGKFVIPAIVMSQLLKGSPVEAAEIKQPELGTPIKYDSNVGSIVNENTDQPATQNQILSYIKDNPLKVTAGTSLAFAAPEVPGAYKTARDLGRGKVRSALGITGALKPLLTTIGTPAMTGLLEVPIAAKRLEEGETATEILTDPFGPALGVAFMEPFSRGAGVIQDAPKRTMAQGLRNYFNLSNVGQARPGLTSSILRLGMSPRMIAGATRFLGIPGLLLGTGLSAYDAYKNYQNQEGFLYNLLNRDE